MIYVQAYSDLAIKCVNIQHRSGGVVVAYIRVLHAYEGHVHRLRRSTRV
jgi:hypothetical protein